MSVSFQWDCPHCQRPQVVTNSNFFEAAGKIRNPHGEFGPVCYSLHSVTCQNPACGKMTLGLSVLQRIDYGGGSDVYQTGALIRSWTLMPESDVKPQPDYIPKALI